LPARRSSRGCSPWPRTLFLTLPALAISALAACAGSTALVLPADLAQVADRYTVAGRIALFTPKITFGPYVAKARGYRSGSDVGEMLSDVGTDIERDQQKRRGSFDLLTPSGKVHGACAAGRLIRTRHRRGDYQLNIHPGGATLSAPDIATVVEDRTTLHCSLKPAFSSELRLSMDDSGRLHVHRDDVTFSLIELDAQSRQVRLAWRLKAGFLIMEGSTPVGAVDLSESYPSATLVRDLPQQRKDEVAAIVMALILMRDI
jgi:hypothetical protein